MNENNSILSIKGLKTEFRLKDGNVLHAVDGIDLDIKPGEIHGLVGESGCGKTVTALSILRLINKQGFISGGEIIFQDKDLLRLYEKEMQKIRGAQISMIFQDPLSSLNPVFTIGNQLSDVISLHHWVNKRDSTHLAIEALKKVNLDNPESRMKQYPHEISGGMRQRAMIAMAVSCNPKLLIADEPTTALDVVVQAHILDLLNRLKIEMGFSVLLISHNMAIIGNNCDRISVMYNGKIFETAPAKSIINHPRHPYTEGLIESVPTGYKGRGDHRKLHTIPESEGADGIPFCGCRFIDRCEEAISRCEEEEPDLTKMEKDHYVRCWKY